MGKGTAVTVTQAHRDAIVDFAKEPCDRSHRELEPWSSAYHLAYKVSPPPFGAFEGHLSGVPTPGAQPAVSFTYKPMTKEDFVRLSGESLPPEDDPGGPPGFWGWAFDYQVFESRYESAWYRYYLASEDIGETTAYGPPGDAPWTAELKENWDTAVDHRLAEVDVVRGELGYLMEHLVKAADKYADTDLANKVDLSQYEDV